jgi:CheY-like chemotaxis protein
MAKILIVEDHPDMRELLIRQIEAMGMTPIAARHGAEAVQKALAEKPNLILMDILMPVLNGLEATKILRSNPATRSIPILAATALFFEPEILKCIHAGCNDYLTKPFTFHQLRRKVQGWISPEP